MKAYHVYFFGVYLVNMSNCMESCSTTTNICITTERLFASQRLQIRLENCSGAFCNDWLSLCGWAICRSIDMDAIWSQIVWV